MRLELVLICILCAQTSASFFDEFRGAMSSVENSFGKLLSDVVTDVQETIGCTILAVKQVLAFGGIYHESSDYDSRCKNVNNKKEASTYIQEKIESPIMPSVPKEKSLSARVSEEMDESFANVHDTMFDLIDKNGAYKNIVKAKANIAYDSERLSEISELLRRELSTIPEDIRMELRRLQFNSIHPTVESIWNNIKTLHEIELSHKNTPEATEIRHILNEVLSVLRGHEFKNGIAIVDSQMPTGHESTDAFLEIESQFERIEQDQKEIDNLDDSRPNESINSDLKQDPNIVPLTFKEAKKIIDGTSRTFRLADGSAQVYEHIAPTTTEKPITTQKYVDSSDASADYNSFFQLAPQDSPARKKAVQEATNLIEKSKKNDAIMNDFLKKADKVGTNVFDNPDLMEFA